MNMARAVTLPVPAIKARAPYRLWEMDEGNHSGLVKNSMRSNLRRRRSDPSLNTKKKILKTKIIALTPQSRIIHSITGSANISKRCRLTIFLTSEKMLIILTFTGSITDLLKLYPFYSSAQKHNNTGKPSPILSTNCHKTLKACSGATYWLIVGISI